VTQSDSGPMAAGGKPDPTAILLDRSYLALLLLGALLGAPVAVVGLYFLKVVAVAQTWVFTTLPTDLGVGQAAWWPLIPLTLSGLVVGLSIHYLPGTSGHKPAEGFKASGATQPMELPGVILASLATLCLGAVLGPEAPLIAIGGGMGVLAVRLAKRDAPAQATMVIAAAGSFAAVSTLLGSPLVGAFLMLEIIGIGGPLIGVVLAPGLLAAGIGSLVFVGVGRWTGFGTMSLAIPGVPSFDKPTLGEMLWAIVIGLAAAVVGSLIKRGALFLQPIVERRILLLTPLIGLAVGGLAGLFQLSTNRSYSLVLFSGQSALPGLIQDSAKWSAGALVALMVFKGLAYSISLSGLRGGPTFPGMFIGAAGGMALSHLAGLPMISGVAMGIGAMTVAMLGLPLTSVLLTAVFLQADAVALMPLIIIAVAVSYVASVHLTPALPGDPVDAAAAPSSA
jgi:H+/Cl- antiporter ClcA